MRWLGQLLSWLHVRNLQAGGKGGYASVRESLGFGVFHLPKFPSAALPPISVAAAAPHSSALQAENLSCVKSISN